jgi:hypothetical protein
MRRATWVRGRPDPDQLVPWAVQHDVGEIFLGVGADIDISPDLPRARAVVEQAKEAGLKVSALGGDQGWIDNPADALAWSRAAIATGLFAGIHVDIDPWARSDWDRRRRSIVSAYLFLLRRLAASCPLPLEADVAHWLHEVPTATGEPLDAAVMDIVDAVTVLSFRNTATGPDSITEVGAPGLAAARSVGIPCRLAVETKDLPDDPGARRQSFFGLGAAPLSAAMETVDAMETSVASYNGIAVHDHEGWVALGSRP